MSERWASTGSSLSLLLLDVLETLAVGLVLLDAEQRVVLWNRWMVKASGIPAGKLLGRPIVEALPELAGTRLAVAIASVLSNGLPVVLSPSLNRAPFKLSCPPTRDGTRLPMQQSVQLMSLRDESDQQHCLIQVQDVTAISQREQVLRERTEVLRRYAYLDSLTGVANRRFFEEELAREWKAARRSGAPLGLLLVDVDYFKRYNDSLGHQAGDQCLSRVAQAMKRMLLRGEDILARYGGEEFAVLLPCTDVSGCRQIAARLQAELARLALPHPDSSFDVVTVSIGMASLRNQAGVEAEELVRQADEALYRAKQGGRNRLSD